jgi:hypothetical protein
MRASAKSHMNPKRAAATPRKITKPIGDGWTDARSDVFGRSWSIVMGQP